MANLNDVLQGLVNLNSKMANNINNLLDSIGEGFLDVGELKVENSILSLQGATILVNGSNIVVENLSTTFAGNRICFLEYKADKSIALKVLSVVDANFNYDLSQLSATSKHFEIARQYNGVLEDRRVASMASKDNTIVGALNGALKAIDYDNEMDLEINMDILSRVSAVESDIVDLDTKKADKTYVDEAVANVDIDGVVTAVDVGKVEGVDLSYVTRAELDEALSGLEVDVDLTSYQEKSDNSLSTTDKTIVGAINELFQSANNGKELIASAIGEPLDASDTFQAMSDKIKSLLNTFKSNMMNGGIDVTEDDDISSLINKVETMKSGGGYNIEVVSELPAKADDYQIAILDPNTDAHIYIDTIESPSALNMYSFKDGDIYVRNITSIDIPGVHRAKMLTQNITKSYTIQSVLKYNSGSFSYLGDSVYEYLDNKWNLIFGNVLNIYRDSVLVNDVTFGRYSSSSGTSVNTSVNAEQYQVTYNKPTSTHLACSTNVPIDVTNYNKLIFELKSFTFSSVSGDFYVGVRQNQGDTGFVKSTILLDTDKTPGCKPGAYIVDVSNLTGSYYLGIGAPDYKHSCTNLVFNFSAIYLTV